MSASATRRFTVRIGRMTTYTAEIPAEDEDGARAIATFLMDNADVFDAAFYECDEEFDILEIIDQQEAVS